MFWGLYPPPPKKRLASSTVPERPKNGLLVPTTVILMNNITYSDTTIGTLICKIQKWRISQDLDFPFWTKSKSGKILQISFRRENTSPDKFSISGFCRWEGLIYVLVWNILCFDVWVLLVLVDWSLMDSSRKISSPLYQHFLQVVSLQRRGSC